MKKVILVLLVAIGFGFGANGSGLFVSSGVTMGNLRLPIDSEDTTMEFYTHPPRPTVSVGYEFSLTPSFSIVSLSKFQFQSYEFWNGTNYWDPIEGIGDKIIYDFTSFNILIPILFKGLIPINNGGISISAGPFVEVLFAQHEYLVYKNRVTLGISTTVGGEIKIKKHSLVLEAGYDFTFIKNSIGREYEGEYVVGETYADNILTYTITLLSVGVRFNIKPHQ